MIYNETAKIYTVSEVSDGMGGYEEQMEFKAEIPCKVAPFTVRTVNSAGLIITKSRNKLFTQEKDYLDDIYSDYYIEYKGVLYNKLSVMDAGKCLISEMETIGKADGYKNNN
jgi:hypothetical protein